MSYPPNSPSIIRRNPQHGIHIAGLTPHTKPTLPTSSSHESESSTSSHSRTSSSSTSSWDLSSTSPPHNTHTTVCAETHCTNKIAVIPFSVQGGFDALGGAVNIKARCKKCEPHVVVAQLLEGYIMGWKGEVVTGFAEQKWKEAGAGEGDVEGQW